jgi:hypothetical protein
MMRRVMLVLTLLAGLIVISAPPASATVGGDSGWHTVAREGPYALELRTFVELHQSPTKLRAQGWARCVTASGPVTCQSITIDPVQLRVTNWNACGAGICASWWLTRLNRSELRLSTPDVCTSTNYHYYYALITARVRFPDGYVTDWKSVVGPEWWTHCTGV